MAEALNYYKQYKDLEVRFPGEVVGSTGNVSVTVHIDNYQNTGSTNPLHATTIDETQSTKLNNVWMDYLHTPYDPTRPWRHFVEFVQPETSDPKGDASSRLNSFYNVFHGKGSVAEIRFVLQLQAWKHRPDAAGKRAWKDSTTAQIALQEFCVQKIGLDCNGFVTNCANYINKLKLLPSVVASTSTLAFTKKAHLRPSTDKVKAYDVISYLQAGDVVDQNISHVCMIDQVLTQDTEKASITLVESAGHFGLRYSPTGSVTLKDTGRTGVNSGRVFALIRVPAPGWSLSKSPAFVYVSAPYLS